MRTIYATTPWGSVVSVSLDHDTLPSLKRAVQWALHYDSAADFTVHACGADEELVGGAALARVLADAAAVIDVRCEGVLLRPLLAAQQKVEAAHAEWGTLSETPPWMDTDASSSSCFGSFLDSPLRLPQSALRGRSRAQHGSSASLFSMAGTETDARSASSTVTSPRVAPAEPGAMAQRKAGRDLAAPHRLSASACGAMVRARLGLPRRGRRSASMSMLSVRAL